MKSSSVVSLLACGLLACAGSSPSGPAAPAPSSPEPIRTSIASDRAPAFSVDSLTTGGKLTIVPGKVTLVYFWATWNHPCQVSFPRLQDLYAKYHDSGLEIAALSVDDDSTSGNVTGAARAWGATFPVGWDRGRAVATAWQPETMPTLFVVDGKGVIVGEHRGWRDGADADVERDVKRLLFPPSATAVVEARRLRAQGRAAMDRAEHASALELFRTAERFAPEPDLTYDIGRALELMGRRAEAAEEYLRYLHSRLSHTDRMSMELRVKTLLSSP